MNEEAKNLIANAKNICILPSSEPEAVSAALALFYTLRELNKNVNVMIDEVPSNLQFLIPSLEFISTPKNFVISIPKSIAEVSQIYYEKNEEHLKINLTVNNGRLTKENISFYATQAKPDVIISLGIQDWQKELHRLDAFGFLLDAPIINIDANPENKKFGQFNLTESASLSQATTQFIKAINPNPIKQGTANGLLAGLMIRYENLQSKDTSPEIFALASDLIKQGADYHAIVENINRSSDQEIAFLSAILQGMQRRQGAIAVTAIQSNDFYNFPDNRAAAVVEKLRTIGLGSDLLVLWQSHASDPAIKGFFLSHKANLINKFAEYQPATIKHGWVSFLLPGQNIETAQQEIVSRLQ